MLQVPRSELHEVPAVPHPQGNPRGVTLQAVDCGEEVGSVLGGGSRDRRRQCLQLARVAREEVTQAGGGPEHTDEAGRGIRVGDQGRKLDRCALAQPQKVAQRLIWVCGPREVRNQLGRPEQVQAPRRLVELGEAESSEFGQRRRWPGHGG